MAVLDVPRSGLEELRQRFDELRPELETHAAALTAHLPEPCPTPRELVEITWQVVRSRPGSVPAYATVERELDCALHNWILRARIAAGGLDNAFEYLLPHLRTWATNLSHGLPAPRPDPDDFVNDAFVKLRTTPAFGAADNPMGYAFRVVKNLIVDHARRASRAAELAQHYPPRVLAELETSPARLDAIARRAQLSADERCMVFRKVFVGMSVIAAQKACGGPPGSPYYVLEKIYDKLATAFGVERNRV
jgi:DNA-directed RNA polymerase specialized sigma24 family protein